MAGAMAPSSSTSTAQLIERLQGMRGIRPQQLSVLEMRDIAPIPGVPQIPIERYRTDRSPSDVQRGFSDRTRTVLRDVERGMQQGAHEWYFNEPLRNQFIMELGEAEGSKQYDLFASMVAGTSSSAPVRNNIRKASWYRKMALEGLLPNNIDSKEAAAAWLADHPRPEGYGSIAAENDAMWASRFLAGDQLWRARDPGAAHKILSFDPNLRGNLSPWTGDRHEGTALGVPPRWTEREGWQKGQLTPNEYVAAERMMVNLADRIGIAPAQLQSARWIGGAGRTGVRSKVDPTFSHAIEARAIDQAKNMRETPEWVIRDFIRNLGLLSAPAALPVLSEGE